jgi:hypothetical protein
LPPNPLVSIADRVGPNLAILDRLPSTRIFPSRDSKAGGNLHGRF